MSLVSFIFGYKLGDSELGKGEKNQGAGEAKVSNINKLYVEDFKRLPTETDDTRRINEAVQFAIKNGYNALELSAKLYLLRGTIVIPTGFKVIGTGWERRSTNGKGTRIRRIENVIALRASGQSVRIGTPGHIQSIEFVGIRFEGGDLSEDFMLLEATSLAVLNNCQFFGMGGRQLYLKEVMDSRVLNCSFDVGGTTDGSLPAVELYSGGDIEYTNQIHFVGCRWESYRGTALALTGKNTNEIFFTNCKMESLTSNEHHLTIIASNVIRFDGVQITSKGSRGETIKSIVDVRNSSGIFGELLLEHLGSGATLNHFVNFNKTSNIDIFVYVYNGGDDIISSYVVNVNGGLSESQSVRGLIRGSNPNSKQISNIINYNVESFAIRSYGTPTEIIEKHGASDRWYRKVSTEGNFTKMEVSRIKEGKETIIERTDQNSDKRFLTNVFFDKGVYLPNLSNAPWETNGAIYYDTKENVVKIYVNGKWRNINIT